MLKIKFWRIENVLLMKVLEQGDEIERGLFHFSASNGVDIKSTFNPQMRLDVLYIRGDDEDIDDEVVHFDCGDERKGKCRD